MTTTNTGGDNFDRIDRPGGGHLAFRRAPGRGPGVVFLTGFRSDMTGTKAITLESFCRERGQAFLRFDYSGHGASSGVFTEGTIGDWAADAIFALDHLTEGPQVLVGSSMGGWIMLLMALARPERVTGLIGLAPAPDFTEDMIWDRFTDEERREFEAKGIWYEPSEYGDEPTPITRKLIEEGRKNLLLRAPIALHCPVRILQGVADPDVPWQTALRLGERLESADVEITLIKSGDHRLSEPTDLARLTRTLGIMLDQLSA